MNIYLYQVGRNLNRAVRTCAFFDISHLYLVCCDDARSTGNLFSAANRVSISTAKEIPIMGTLALEDKYCTPLWEIDWHSVENILIGGETVGIPPNDYEQRAVIPKIGKSPSLTVEAALAITLYEWRRQWH